jgi:hypothetical protein
MASLTKLEKLFRLTKQFILGVSKKDYISDAKCFTRQRALTWETCVYLILSCPKTSLSVFLHNTLKFNKLPLVTKGGFSQARYKIKSVFFNDLIL